MAQENNYVIYGMRPVKEAVATGKEIEKILFKQGLEGDQFRELFAEIQGKGIPYQFVPGERIARYGKGHNQGIVAFLSRIDYVPFEEAVEQALAKSDNPIFIMLDGVSDVHNLGAIARTAECAGVSAVIVPAKGGAAINAEAIKASAGALLRINTCRTQNLRVPIYYLKERGFSIVAASEKSDGLIYDIDFTKPTAIIMGSEGKGVSRSVLELCDEKARIPMFGETASLNVSVAASIILFETVRQRQ